MHLYSLPLCDIQENKPSKKRATQTNHRKRATDQTTVTQR